MNSEQTWSAVDEYLGDLLGTDDAVLKDALAASAEGGLPEIQVSATQGKLLHLLARLHGARHILELGTLGGYSTIWLARALPTDGQLVTLEYEPKHAEVARRNFQRAGVASLIDLRVGAALDILPQLEKEGRCPFDLIFIDADKDNYPDYFRWALRLSRRGTVIIADNVIRKGAVIEPDHSDPRVQGVRRFLDLVAAEPRVSATAIQTVGAKGYDGFAFALVNADA
ncbi:O-methyltransferase family 3 [Chthoniobacter flavus Ellin428]|uniref:O-methyltransferase family 3 n=1 Tax=Chthoniobacter flavus Ellin428 TaxID=497964 RepID=B4D6W5_9BACT|nr:O-methyltransferase [Chthoniobacter flavus]EDY17916.1 O-methyltransferase family 3 [Chthoniobacter flavus Ellin428]TCO88523.1 putative O-methyltransferase YrrM [Chthoniobacter flavus]